MWVADKRLRKSGFSGTPLERWQQAHVVSEGWASELMRSARDAKAEQQSAIDTDWDRRFGSVAGRTQELSSHLSRQPELAARVHRVTEHDALIVVDVPPEPSLLPTTTALGKPTVKQATKTQRAEWARGLTAAMSLNVARSSLSAVPGLGRARVLALRDGQPVLALTLTAEAARLLDLDVPAWDLAVGGCDEVRYQLQRRTKELGVLDLDGDPIYQA